jgi:hypothetical protein
MKIPRWVGLLVVHVGTFHLHHLSQEEEALVVGAHHRATVDEEVRL